MKTLLLLRHAKSDRDDPTLSDFERPLNSRGERDAPRIGKALREQGGLPDRILCSPAVRARQTMEAVVKAAHLEITPQFVEGIYGASVSLLADLVRAVSDTSSCVLVVGHNPGMEELVAYYTGALEPMPTAALACLVFEVAHWAEVDQGEGRLAWRLTPRELDND